MTAGHTSMVADATIIGLLHLVFCTWSSALGLGRARKSESVDFGRARARSAAGFDDPLAAVEGRAAIVAVTLQPDCRVSRMRNVLQSVAPRCSPQRGTDALRHTRLSRRSRRHVLDAGAGRSADDGFERGP